MNNQLQDLRDSLDELVSKLAASRERSMPDPWFDAVTDVVFGDPMQLTRMRRAMQERDDVELGRLFREAVDEALAVNAGQLAADRAEGIA